jgi:hypothetical protein
VQTGLVADLVDEPRQVCKHDGVGCVAGKTASTFNVFMKLSALALS